jgi:outer membrane autotransporter protein
MSAGPTSPPGTTLTTKSYVGSGGGAIVLNTFLGADHSPTDRLVIDGGAATGSTILRIVGAGGTGVLTTANGIKVVDAINGATTSSAAFTLGNRVAAGAYEYALFYGGNAASGGNPNSARPACRARPAGADGGGRAELPGESSDGYGCADAGAAVRPVDVGHAG